MDRKGIKFVLLISLGTIAAIFLAAMLDFHPFPGNDLTVRAIQFCTLIICVVIAICAWFIVSRLSKK